MNYDASDNLRRILANRSAFAMITHSWDSPCRGFVVDWRYEHSIRAEFWAL